MKSRSLQYRILVLLFAVLFLVFLCSDFKIPTLSERAVITAVGVENSGDGEYKLSFVLAKSKNGERENSVVQTSAKTVAGGVSQLENAFGLTPKLSYASLVMVEKEVAKSDIFSVISFFLNTNGVHDSAKLIVCDESPSDIFSAVVEGEKSGYDALSKVLSIADKKPITAPMLNLKDFAEIYFSNGKDAVLPCVELKKSGESDAFYVGNAYLFKESEIIDKINGDMSLILNILQGKGKGGNFTAIGAKTGEEIADVRVAIVNSDCEVKKEIKLGTPKIEVNLKMKVGVLDQNVSQKTLGQVSGAMVDKEGIATACEKFLEENINMLMEKSFAQTADFLGIGEHLERKHAKEFQALQNNKENYLENATIKAAVEVEVLQNYRV